MYKYVALLRGIMPSNPNMRSEKLKAVFVELGFENVQSVISSGNIIFESEEKDTTKIEKRIEKAFPKELGFHSSAIVRTRDDLQNIIKAHPFSSTPDVPASRLNVSFLKTFQKTMPEVPHKNDAGSYRVFRIDGRTLGVVVNTTQTSTTEAMNWLEANFGKDITTRTWKTIHRILKKLD